MMTAVLIKVLCLQCREPTPKDVIREGRCLHCFLLRQREHDRDLTKRTRKAHLDDCGQAKLRAFWRPIAKTGNVPCAQCSELIPTDAPPTSLVVKFPAEWAALSDAARADADS